MNRLSRNVTDVPLTPGSFGLEVKEGVMHVPQVLIECVFDDTDINYFAGCNPKYYAHFLAHVFNKERCCEALGWTQEQFAQAVTELQQTLPPELLEKPPFIGPFMRMTPEQIAHVEARCELDERAHDVHRRLIDEIITPDRGSNAVAIDLKTEAWVTAPTFEELFLKILQELNADENSQIITFNLEFPQAHFDLWEGIEDMAEIWS